MTTIKFTVEKGFIDKMHDALISYENAETFDTLEQAERQFNRTSIDDGEYKELCMVEFEDDEIIDSTIIKSEER